MVKARVKRSGDKGSSFLKPLHKGRWWINCYSELSPLMLNCSSISRRASFHEGKNGRRGGVILHRLWSCSWVSIKINNYHVNPNNPIIYIKRPAFLKDYESDFLIFHSYWGNCALLKSFACEKIPKTRKFIFPENFFLKINGGNEKLQLVFMRPSKVFFH